MQNLPHMDERRQMTLRCVQHIERQSIPRTFSSIGRDIGVHEKTIRNIATPYLLGRMAGYVPEAPTILGIDELGLDGEGRGIFMDMGARRTLDIIPSCKGRYMARWISTLPNRDRIKLVTMDMTRAYLNVVRGLLPKANVVMDKFHVLRMADEAFKEARSERRKVKGIRKNPRGALYLLRTHPDRLDAKQQFALDGIRKNDPIADAGHTAKEGFYNIWKAKDRATAEKLFDEWAETIPDAVGTEFNKLARSIQRWRPYVFSYFDYPATNALTETHNGLIKHINRAGRGYTFDIIRAKAVLSEPLGNNLRECPYCHGQYPATSFRPWPAFMAPPPEAQGILAEAHRLTLAAMEEQCMNCHFSIQKVEGPPPDGPSVEVPLEEFAAILQTSGLMGVIEKYGPAFHVQDRLK